MKRRKQKCIKGLSASASSRLRKRVRNERFFKACCFVWACEGAMWPKCDDWHMQPYVQAWRASYNRARALAAECGV